MLRSQSHRREDLSGFARWDELRVLPIHQAAQSTRDGQHVSATLHQADCGLKPAVIVRRRYLCNRRAVLPRGSFGCLRAGAPEPAWVHLLHGISIRRCRHGTDSYWRTRCVGEAMDQGYTFLRLTCSCGRITDFPFPLLLRRRGVSRDTSSATSVFAARSAEAHRRSSGSILKEMPFPLLKFLLLY